LVRGERVQTATTAASLKKKKKTFQAAFQITGAANEVIAPQHERALYTNCKVRTINFPASPCPAHDFNPILVFAISFSPLGWLLFTAHSSCPLDSFLVAGGVTVHMV